MSKKPPKGPRTTFVQNKLIRAPGIQYNYTQDEVNEVVKCAADPIYFIENYIKIMTKDHGLQLMKLYPFQRKLILSFLDNRYTIGKIFRQAGKTSCASAFFTWWIIFKKAQVCAIIANKEKTAREIIRKIKRIYETIPMFLQSGVTEWNKTSIALENGSRIITSSTSADSIRGFDINLLFLDEFAFIPPNIAEEFFASVYPTISSGKTTKVIIISTPNGYNFFHKMWKEAEKGRNGFQTIETNWREVRDQEWADDQLRVLGPMKYAQEVECDFLGSSNTLIGSQYIRTMVDDIPIAQNKEGTIIVYSNPKQGRQYLLVCDPSKGTGLDYTSFIVFDVSEYPFRIVQIFRDNMIDTLVVPSVIYNIATQYNKATVLIELNNNGKQIADIMQQDLEYENMVTIMYARPEFGVQMTQKVKGIGCTNFKSMVENQKLIINDLTLQSEISTFIQRKKSYEADPSIGAHDDLVMCCVLLGWFIQTDQFKEVMDLDMRKAIRERQAAMVEESLTPFGFMPSESYDEKRNPELLDDDDRLVRFLLADIISSADY